MKTEDFSKFSTLKTERWRQAESVKIKCKGCVLKYEDPKINYGWLDPPLSRFQGKWLLSFDLQIMCTQTVT